MSMRAGSKNSSSNNNSNSSSSNNHMSSRRASGPSSSRRISESSSCLGSAASTTSTSATSVKQTTMTTTQQQEQQHAADKSSVKRKKRRKDEEKEEERAIVVERVPVVLLTRLEDERKSKESKSKPVTTAVKKVVVERPADGNESIKASSSDKSVAVGKRSTRHSVHRSSENLAGSDAKILQTISEEEKKKKEAVVVVVVEESSAPPPKKSIVSSSNKNADQTADSQSNKVKPVDSSAAECNVNNVNNDNLKTTDPKITERQLLVRLDRSQVEDYLKKKLCAQRLLSEDKLLLADTDKYHSEDENQESDVLSKTSSQEIKTCAIPSDAGVADQTDIQSDVVERTSVDDVTGKIDRIQPNTEEPVELENKKKARTRKNKNVVIKVARKVVKNQRLSTRDKRKVKSQDIAGKSNEEDGDKDLRGNTKINEESSVQTNENQIQRLDEISKDTSCESAKSHGVVTRRSRALSQSSESLNESAVVAVSATDSSKKSNTDEINKETIESNSIDDKSIASDGGNVVAEPPVQLPMEVDGHSVADDSKAESDSAQPICDIHSKNVVENAKSLPEEVETIDKSTKEILSESTEPLTESLADSASSESPVENLMKNSNDSAKNSDENDASELPSANSIAVGETAGVSTDNLVSDEAIGSPSDSFMSCENAESMHGGSTSGENNDSLIETIEDTESSASTCTLIEETPEELSQNIDKELEDELPEDVDKQSEVSKEVTHQDVPKEVDATKEPVAEKEVESLENDAVDGNSKVNESFSQEDKIGENNEHESTFENNLKSVENLVIDSILNGEIVSPKIIARSASSKTEEVQTFVFESGVEDFVNDIEVPKETPVSLEPSTPAEVAANLERSAPVAEESPVKALEPAEIPIPAERPVAGETLPLPVAEKTAVEKPTAEKIVESPPVTEEEPKAAAETSSGKKPVDEEFAKHRRKHTLSELKKKCTENIGKRHARTLEKDHESPLPPNVVAENHSESRVALAPRDCFLEQTAVSNESYFENVSDTESEICLADRLNRLANLNIPSLEDSLSADKPVHSEGEESSRSEGTRRQRILMKITKTEANKHVTHLVEESKEEEEGQTTSTEQQQQQQFTGEQVTEGEIKIIMRKESTSNNHVIKEIKIIPRTPEGGNSARIPGYSPTSSDLSSGNSSCRVPSCSPAKPDSGSYRMPGWSPASTETGQTTTIKRKQGRPKKYPIFTESELIAKTTAIVNNVDVHAANKLAEKPLFEPVESIRINEHEVMQQQDEEEEELNQTVISEQMCLSGNQLLDAMPAKPDVLAKYASNIDETALTKKKKRMGRPRKYPMNDDATKVTEHTTVARIEFNVVDSIEEFVEPPHSQSLESQAGSPTKKKPRGRPRKVPPLQDDEESVVEQGGDVTVKKRGRKPRLFSQEDTTSMGETDDDTPVAEADQPRVERRGRKPYKHLKNNTESQLSENQIAEGAYSTTEDEAGHDVVEKHRDRVSRKLERGDSMTDGAATEGETSMTENESASIAVPRVERRGRKPWKHLKNNVALAENVTPAAENTQLNNESVLSENQATEEEENENDASVPKPRVERRGRKPWKHLKNNIVLAENDTPVAESTQLNNESVLSEGQATEEEENENDPSMPKPRVERRGRKPWKHLKNNVALAEGEVPAVEKKMGRPRKIQPEDNVLPETQVAAEVSSITEDEAVNDTPVVEPVVESAEGFLQDDGTTPPESAVAAEEVKSVAEDDRMNDAPLPQGPPVNETTSTIENEISEPVAEVIVKKKRGRKSLKSLQDANSLPDNAALEEEANSMTEDDFEDETSLIERMTRKAEQQPIHFPNDSQSAEETEDSAAENVNASDAPVPKKRGRKPRKHLLNEMASELPVGEKKKRGRPRKIQLDGNVLSETQVIEGANSMTEDEAVNDTPPTVEPEKILQGDSALPPSVSTSSLMEDETVSSTEDIPTKKRSGRPPKIIKVTFASSHAAEESSSSMTEDETVSSTEDIPRIEQQHQQHQPVVKKNKPGRPRKIVQFDASAMMVAPVVVKRRGRPPKNLLLVANDSTAPEDTTEDETVSSTEDIPRIEHYHPAMKKNKPGRPRKIWPLPFAATEEHGKNDSVAASSMEDLSMVKPPPKKRGRKPRATIQNDGSSMEDLTTFVTPALSPRKRGRPPKSLSPYKISLPKNHENSILEDASSDSIEEFTPVKPMSPVKQQQPHDAAVTPIMLERVAASLYEATFGNKQPAYDRSLSPVKRRGRPPKYPRKYIIDDDSQEVLAGESRRDSLVASPATSEKRKGRPPRRLSQDENILPGISKNDAQSSEKAGRSPRRLSHDGGFLSTPALVHAQHNDGDDVPAAATAVPVTLGKRQGRPPRKFSPDEERSFSVLPQTESDQAALIPARRPPGRPRKYSLVDGLPFSSAAFSDSDETSVVKRKGRRPKKFTPDEGGETVKRKGRPPKYVGYDESLPLPQTSETESTNKEEHSLPRDESPPLLLAPLPPLSSIVSDNEPNIRAPVIKASTEGATISTTNLLRQQRKPKMSQQPQQQATPPTVTFVQVVAAAAAAAVETNAVPQPEATPQVTSPLKKRGRQPKLPSFDIQKRQQQDDDDDDDELPDNLTAEQLRRRRHSQDDSMFREDLLQLCKERPKEFEDAQQKPKRRRGRQPKLRDMSKDFVMEPLKPKTIGEAIAQAVSPTDNPRNRLVRPKKLSPDKYAPMSFRPIAPKPAPTTQVINATKITAADFLRTWTDRDDSPGSKANSNKFTQDDSSLPRDFVLGLPRPLSRNRLRRYSQGDAVEQSNGDSLLPKRKRTRSSGSEDSLMQDEKRPRVEKELRDQHSITKELVVQLTKIDKSGEESTTPAVEQQQQQQQQQPIREILKMSLRRKLESNSSNAAGGPPPLVPIEPRIQPATHSDAKLLMLMQPSTDDKALQLHHPHPHQQHHQHIQPAPQQFCIIFIPDALTSAESALNKDSQPTATIVNFQPVPDAELASKSVIYTPTTTPTKIFVNDEQHNRSFLCATCTQALDLVGRLEANVGMTEEDKSAIKCPYCSKDFQSLFYLEYHLRQEHLKCENDKQCRHSGFNTLRIPSHDASSESEIYITFALKCRSCYALFENVITLNEHVKAKHANLIRHKPPSSFSNAGMVCYPPPPFKNGARPEVLHCPSDCICRIGIRSTDSPMQRAQVLKRCPNFMRRMEKIEAAAYEVFTCTLCRGTFLMKHEVVEHLMKMHEVSCKFPCTKCLISFRAVQTQESHHCSETTIRDLDKLISIVILPTDKAHDNSKFEDSSNDELGPIKTTPPPAVPSASTPLNGVKRKNGVIQKLSKYLAMQPPKKPKLDAAPTTPLTTTKKRLKKTPCPKCQKKFAYRKSLNDHIIFEHIIPCKKADEASKKMAVELLQLVNGNEPDHARIEELARALGKYTDDDGVSLKKLTMINDEQENWNEARKLDEKDSLQCFNCKANFKPASNSANLARRNNHQQQPNDSPPLCERCDLTRRRQQQRNVVNNGHNFNLKATTNGEQQRESQQPAREVRYTYECDRCSKTYPTMIELNRHKSEEHSNKPSDALPCDVCSKIFYSSRMLEKHKKMHDDSLLSRSIEDGENTECNNQSVGDVSKDSEANSSTSRRDSTDNSSSNKEEEACKCPHCEFSAEKVSLKNHLKREHGVMAFICQFCGKLLVEISEVRHMLDYHIKSSRKSNGNVGGTEKSADEVMELLRTLGKKRLQSLMIYHDFEGKCNNAIMRCPICPEQFATRESCRHHYQWMHDSTCLLCDANFSGGNIAGQHKVAVHNSIASYVWAIQRLVSAIVHGLRLDRAHPSHVLYQEVSMRLDMLEADGGMIAEGEQSSARSSNVKTGAEEAVVSEPFLEPVVLSEDQLPGSGNMIEVVIGNDMVVEDSEDNLLEDFYLSPNYESSCEQPKILDAGAPIPELEEEEEMVVAAVTAPTVAMATTTTCTATLAALPATPSLTTSNGAILIPTAPVTAETYATSAVFKLRQDNGQEEVVLAITDEDLVTYRDDIGSLAERLSATCDSLSLEEITTMLRSYFENVGTPQAVEEVEVASAIEPRTQ